MPYRNLLGAGICLLAVSAGCQSPSDTAARTTEPATEQAQNALTTEDHRLSWSDLTLRPKGFDQLAEGPSAVAVAADGSTLLLDRLGARIVAVGADGASRELATVDPDVEDIAVVGVPDETWGEVGYAFVITKPGANPAPDDLINFCDSRLARYKWPKKILFAEDFPRTALGKVRKTELKQQYLGMKNN